MSRRRKGQLVLFFILVGAAGLFVLLLIMKEIHVSSILQVKKTISISTDLSDKGTAVLGVLNREYQGKKYIQVLGESIADNHASYPQDAYDSLKATIKNMEDYFIFDFSEKPLGLDLKGRPEAPTYGECGHSDTLNIKLQWPSETKRVTSGFGYRNEPRPCYCHSGVDIASGDPLGGDEVKAAYNGKVIKVYDKCKESPNCFQKPYDNNCGCNDGIGNNIIIEHNSPNGKTFYTLYYHLRDVNVKHNQEVNSGQIIGRSGNTGRSEAPHLHFELATQTDLKDASTLNPCLYFDDAPSDCEKPQITSCSVAAGSNIFEVDIPLPGASDKLKGKAVMEKW